MYRKARSSPARHRATTTRAACRRPAINPAMRLPIASTPRRRTRWGSSPLTGLPAAPDRAEPLVAARCRATRPDRSTSSEGCRARGGSIPASPSLRSLSYRPPLLPRRASGDRGPLPKPIHERIVELRVSIVEIVRRPIQSEKRTSPLGAEAGDYVRSAAPGPARGRANDLQRRNRRDPRAPTAHAAAALGGSIDIPAATGAFAFASAVAVIHVSELLMRPPFAA